MKGASPGAVRAQLGRFGFSGPKATTEVGKLSGGERARLALALITRDAPHMLILDEPTNHLDVDAREALIQALNAYSGAVVIVSHDRHMLEMTADRLVLVDCGHGEGIRRRRSTITSPSCWRRNPRPAQGRCHARGQQEGPAQGRRRGPRKGPGTAQARASSAEAELEKLTAQRSARRPGDVRSQGGRGRARQADHDRTDEAPRRNRRRGSRPPRRRGCEASEALAE